MIIRFLGYATFEVITNNNQKIIIDPFIKDNPHATKRIEDFTELDFILISHGSYSHYGDSVELAKKTNATVMCGPEILSVLVEYGIPREQIIPLTWGLNVKRNGIRFKAVESRHASFITRPNGDLVTGFPLGFIIDDGQTKLYNSSDTALFSDMKLIGELSKLDVGLLNVSIGNYEYLPEGPIPSPHASGEMTAEEAVLAAEWLGLKYAIPCHFEELNDQNVRYFMETLEKSYQQKGSGPKPIFLKPGEEFVIP